MSFLVPRSASIGRSPTSSDDASRGFFVGSTVVDSSVEPPVLYVCTNDTRGSAVWVAAGGMVLQNAGAGAGHAYTLNFAQGSVVVANGVATFTPPSGWAIYASFEAANGQTVFPVANVNSVGGRHMVTRDGLVMRQGAASDYTITATGVVFNYPLGLGDFVQVFS